MSTRAIVKIIPRKVRGSEDFEKRERKSIMLYHHCDGSPKSVGRELERFLEKYKGESVPDGTTIWDAERITEWIQKDPGYKPTGRRR